MKPLGMILLLVFGCVFGLFGTLMLLAPSVGGYVSGGLVLATGLGMIFLATRISRSL